MPIQCAICNSTRDLPEDFNEWPQELGKSLDIWPVTDDGKPTSRIRGYICSYCLSAANSMCFHVRSLMHGVIVTNHAIDRFLERQRGEPMPRGVARRAIIKIYSKSKPIRFKSQYVIKRLFNNDFEEVNYKYAQGFVFVVTKDKPAVIKTIEMAGGKKLNEDFWYVE